MSPRKRKKRRTPPVFLTDRALSDLRQIEEFSVREWGRKTADKYLNDLESALDRLREDPEILRLEPDLAPDLYFYGVRKHYLVCDRTSEMTTVLTVIHTTMDIPARLAELEPRLSAEVRPPAQSTAWRLRGRVMVFQTPRRHVREGRHRAAAGQCSPSVWFPVSDATPEATN